jgi:hypothetical protein
MSISSVLSDLYPALTHSLASSKIEDSRFIGGVGVVSNVLELHSFQMDQLIKKTKESRNQPEHSWLPTSALAATKQRPSVLERL